MAAMQLHWDIFCRVVDNFGDIGVCWRLARQLASEHGLSVRLWVDDLASLQPLCPECDPSCPAQRCQGVEIRPWNTPFVFDGVAEVVIEAFACELPENYLLAMARAPQRPAWINLEYLTAESWAEDCHGMASPHPSLPLVKHFFFPGFSPKTGGLLREKAYDDNRRTFLAGLPTENAATKTLEISLFCYESAPVGQLLDALAAMDAPSICYVPPGKPLQAVTAHLGGSGPWQLGRARVEPVPFAPMDGYDELLWRCDINFVRGEDSFIRAQWAGPAFVWQIYPQDEEAHMLKLEAFLDRYCETLSAKPAEAAKAMFRAWNAGKGVGAAWQHFVQMRAEIAHHNVGWARQLTSQPDLARALVNFCASKV